MVAEVIFSRDILSEIRKYYNRHEIVVILGARQVGKATLMKIIMDEIERSSPGTTYYFDLEDFTIRRICDSGVNSFLMNYPFLKKKGRSYLFLDEIQKLQDPSNFLKILHDHHPYLKVFVSGSSSLQIKSKFSDFELFQKINP